MVGTDCFICGSENPIGFKSQFYEMEDNTLISLANPKFEYQSYPHRLHGGIASTLLDETMGRAIMIGAPDTWGVTIDMETKFIKPLPLGGTLRVVGRITSNRRIFTATGEILLEDGTVAATGSARYLKMSVKNIINDGSDGHEVLHMQELDYEITEISASGPLVIKYKD